MSSFARVVRSHAFWPHAARVRVHRTYDVRYIYTYIYQKNSAIELTSVGLAHARPNEGVITNALQSCSKEVVTRRGNTAVMREFSTCIVVAR